MTLREQRWRVIEGDCLAVMPALPAGSVDAVVTDPPYGLAFMGKAWDNGVPGVPFWAEALRVAKPGAHLLAFGGTRTFHRLTCAIEDAGWEIRDCLSWLYGSGFPKSHNGPWGGTALKPAWEPIIMARKPLIGTVAANHAAHGTGALNIDGCRIATDECLNGGAYSGGERPTSAMGCTGEAGGTSSMLEAGGGRLAPEAFKQPEGRWPANVVLDEAAAGMLDKQAPETGGAFPATRNSDKSRGVYSAFSGERDLQERDMGIGGASRFFYTAKASRSEREAGLSGPKQFAATMGGGIGAREHDPSEPRAFVRNTHPTVKPVDLMRWLVRLVTPAGGLVLDPFTGSGTTGVAAHLEGCRFLGIEREPEYVAIAIARIAAEAAQGTLALGGA